MKACPINFPSGFYWYGGKRRGPGRPPKLVISILDEHMTGDASPSSVCTEDAVPQELADTFITNDERSRVDSESIEVDGANVSTTNDRNVHPKRKARLKQTVLHSHSLLHLASTLYVRAELLKETGVCNKDIMFTVSVLISL